MKFMRNMTGNKMNDYELDDVFHDAVIVLYEKIIKGDFVLTASLQIYLNSVCRFQLLNKIRKSKLNTDFKENADHEDNDENPMSYRTSITDTLDEIDHTNEPLFLAIERALEVMKSAGGKCYELITQFWYKKRSMKELTELFEYTNTDNTKSQKAKCQERLRVMSYNQLRGI